MKAKQEIINGQMLGRYLQEIKIGGLDAIGVFGCNRKESFSDSILFGIPLVLFTLVAFAIALLIGYLFITLGVIAISCLGYFIWWKKSFSHELKYWQIFQRAKRQIEMREYSLELVFQGYFKAKVQAKALHPTDCMQEFHYTLDWVRYYILSLIKQAEDGQKNQDDHQSGFAKGKLDIRFTVAKHVFGYDLDQGQGYKMFFSGQIKRVMTNFV